MKYEMTHPCARCPFRKGTKMLLRSERVEEIEACAGDFPCHETVDYTDNDKGDETLDTQHCAGALIYAEKQERSTQMMRIMERLGMYDRTKLGDEDLVWDDLDEWLDAGCCN